MSFTKCFFCILFTGLDDEGRLGLGASGNLGDEPDEMGDYLDAVQLGTNFTPIHLTAGGDFNCALSLEKAIKCWGELSALCHPILIDNNI